MTPLQRAVVIAGRQGGHITWAQLMDCGVSPTQVGRRCRSHGWEKVLPHTYRIGAIPDTFESRLDAVTMWLGDKGHFCSTTAGHLLGLEGITRPNRITVARASVPSTPPWLKVIRLASEDHPRVRLIRRRRVPPVEWVLLDLAGDLSVNRAGGALDDALRRGLTSVDRVRTLLGSTRRRKGVRILGSLLASRDTRDERVRSGFETRMLRILRRVERAVRADHEVHVQSERFVLDFYLPEVTLGIECHSIKWHLGEDAFRKDVRRHRLLSSVGIEVLYFTWEEVTTTPSKVETEVRRCR